MSKDNFLALSEKITQTKNISWETVLTMRRALTMNYDPAVVMQTVREALAAGHRVTIGFLLDDSTGIGADGRFKLGGDSWIITPQIEEHAKKGQINAGHEVIITGYDDNAVITGPNGLSEQGVFTLRNSWGKDAGNQGDYYMSYHYFKTLVTEVNVIIG